MDLYWIHLPEHINIFTDGYVGISNNPRSRFEQHKNSKNLHLKNALQKYKDVIIFDIMIENHSVDYCKQMEEFYRSEDRIGWNLIKGGGIPPNRKGVKQPLTPEHKEKMLEKIKGRKLYNNGIIQKRTIECPEGFVLGGLKGQKRKPYGPMSEENKQKISIANTGLKRCQFSEEAKENMSNAHIGHIHSDETKEKMRGQRGPQKKPKIKYTEEEKLIKYASRRCKRPRNKLEN